MLEILQFIFSSAWHFIGTCILISLLGGILTVAAGSLELVKVVIHKERKSE